MLERVLDVVPPSFNNDDPIKSLRTDTGFALTTVNNFGGGEPLSALLPRHLPSHPDNTPNTPTNVQHSLECLMEFYITSFHTPQDTNVATEALQTPSGLMASYIEGLIGHCTQELSSPCNGKCKLAYTALHETQLESLLYICNLITGYILGCMVDSTLAEKTFCHQFRAAWPRIQVLLSTGKDEAGLRVPLEYTKGAILAHL